MDNHQDSIIVKHLTSLINELERKLAYPKIDWRRKEQLQTQLAEVNGRLQHLSDSARKHNITRGRRASNHPLRPPISSNAQELASTTSSYPSEKLEVDYR